MEAILNEIEIYISSKNISNEKTDSLAKQIDAISE